MIKRSIRVNFALKLRPSFNYNVRCVTYEWFEVNIILGVQRPCSALHIYSNPNLVHSFIKFILYC